MLETGKNQNIDSMLTEKNNLDTSGKALFYYQPTDAGKPKNKLLRVALLNSYLEGQSHLIEVGNNTILTGRNSAGKTTLMGAIVPFFGTKLSSISKKSEVHKSFVDFYLPCANSYIVYEYLREGKKKCVFVRNNSGIQVFNFIDSSGVDSIKVNFWRPNNGALDRSFLLTDAKPFLIPISDLVKGNYTIRCQFWKDSETYVQEEAITIKG